MCVVVMVTRPIYRGAKLSVVKKKRKKEMVEVSLHAPMIITRMLISPPCIFHLMPTTVPFNSHSTYFI